MLHAADSELCRQKVYNEMRSSFTTFILKQDTSGVGRHKVCTANFTFKNGKRNIITYELNYIFNKSSLTSDYKYSVEIDGRYLLISTSEPEIEALIKSMGFDAISHEQNDSKLKSVMSVLCCDSEGAFILSCFQDVEIYKIDMCGVKLVAEGVNDHQLFDIIDLPEISQN